MEKKNKTLTLALILGAIALSACAATSDNSSSSTPSSTESEILPDSASTESLSEISIPDDSLSYLKGKFYGGGGTLSLDGKTLNWVGDRNLTLTPTSVDTFTLGSLDDPSSLKQVPAVYFNETYNGGNAYCLYADVDGDGYVHLDKKVDEIYETIETFQPDISKYVGTFSAYGDGSDYNYYEIIDPDFDADRDAYPMARCYPYYGSFTNEQEWYVLARVRADKDDVVYYTIEFYDSDDYGYGEYQLIKKETGIELYDTAYEYTFYYSDAGAFNGLSLFDGVSKESVSVSLSVEDGTISFGDKSGTYAVDFDDQGMFVKATFDNEVANLRLRDHYLTYEVNGTTIVYPIDVTSELEGTFTDKTNTVSFEMDQDAWDYVLKWNGTAVTYTYVVANNRKSLSFSVNGVNYIVSPDKGEVSVRVASGESASYFINAERYDALFGDSFFAHDKKNNFALRVDSGFNYTLGSESGKAVYSYWHGDKFPSLILEGSSNNKRLSLIQEDIGYFSLSSDTEEDANLYSKAILDKIYGTYSSDGKDSLIINSDSINYKGAYYEYEFAPAFQSGLGTYNFGISSKLGDFQHNLAGCIYSDKLSLVSKDIFGKIAGTYSLYGTYGIESIKITETGDLTLDTLNEAGDGLNKDVPYTYQIITTGGEDIALLGFPYKGYTVFLYVYEDHVTVAGLDYYKEQIMNAWGVYLDETSSNILYVNDNTLYYNGTALTINSEAEFGSSLVYDTSAGIIAISASEDGASATVVSNGVVTSLTRKYVFTDYSKFVGEYTANDTSVKFEKTATSYQATIGTGTPIDLSDMTIVLKDGKIAIQIPNLFAKYYLILDDATGTVTCEYESSLPPAPPLPPSL